MRALERSDPRLVGRYRVLARLGTGGMATVYFGRSSGRRAVAVKVMHAEFATNSAYRDRFRREVLATRAAGGAYCPSLLDADPDAEIPWLATEFLPSVSLRDAVRRFGALPAEALWPLAAGMAEALASIHRAGIVHLDLKPENVLLSADGPRLVDFGIAAGPSSGRTALDGIPAGSRGFMSPEQAAGATVGPASDVFSFGATLAYACTGDSATELDGIADDRLRQMIANCLHQDPPARPAVAELLDHLAAVTGETSAGTTWLPRAVRAEIDVRTSEAENPPVAPSRTLPAGSRMNRRTLLLAGGALTVAGGASAVLALLPDGSESSLPRPQSSTAPPSPSAVPVAAAPASRTLEFYAFGKTTVKTLTTVVNGKATTVHDVRLPYRRTVQIPPWPQPATWRIKYHCTGGNFRCVVLVDGSEVGRVMRSSTGPDMKDDQEGRV